MVKATIVQKIYVLCAQEPKPISLSVQTSQASSSANKRIKVKRSFYQVEVYGSETDTEDDIPLAERNAIIILSIFCMFKICSHEN